MEELLSINGIKMYNIVGLAWLRAHYEISSKIKLNSAIYLNLLYI